MLKTRLFFFCPRARCELTKFIFCPGAHTGAQQGPPAGHRVCERGGRQSHRPVETRQAPQGMWTTAPLSPLLPALPFEHMFSQSAAARPRDLRLNVPRGGISLFAAECLFSGASVCSEASPGFTAICLLCGSMREQKGKGVLTLSFFSFFFLMIFFTERFTPVDFPSLCNSGSEVRWSTACANISRILDSWLWVWLNPAVKPEGLKHAGCRGNLACRPVFFFVFFLSWIWARPVVCQTFCWFFCSEAADY